jgi:hypothetical protein
MFLALLELLADDHLWYGDIYETVYALRGQGPIIETGIYYTLALATTPRREGR